MAELDALQWQRLNRLLELALELEGDAREVWLDGLAEEAPEVLAVLRQLLAEQQDSCSASPGALTSGDAMARMMLESLPSGDQAGDLMGPYRLLHVLGQGGMSTVWAAERADGGVQRRVALKIPHAEWSDRALTERLARECKVLAELNHPNIAHLYDAGTSASGRPYLALELVDGAQIDHSCSSRGLDTRARVRLFIDVLQAVAYAHARLVVHRDLKPANVLVTAQGQVKLLDFGIAKMLSSDTASAEETELTRLSGRPLTLAYAAPEQVQGGSVTTATDIYALGAVLYELLSGERACRPRDDSRAALEQAILAGRPALPSSVASDRVTARTLRGDLDAILLKALSTAPEQRYATAAAFADDLLRYLDGRAVHARLASQRYRIERFLARNRLMVATATAISLALVSGLGIALWQAHEAARQAGIAANERDRALAALEYRDAVDGFLSDLLQEAGRAGKPISVPELIDRADAMSAREFADSPEPRAAVLKTVADFKLTSEGIAPALKYYDQALKLAGASQDAGLRISIACSQAVLQGISGRPDEARRSLERAADGPETPPTVSAECLGDLAQLELFGSDGAAAVLASGRALEAWRHLSRKSPRMHVELLMIAAEAQALAGQPRVAEAGYRQSLLELQRLGRERGDWGARARFALIESAGVSGDPVTALALVDEAIRMASADMPGSPPPAMFLESRARLLATLDRNQEALQAFRQLADLSLSTDPDRHQRALFGAAMAESSLGQRNEAASLFARAAAASADIDAFSPARAQAALALDRGEFRVSREACSRALKLADLPPTARAILHRLRAEAALGEGNAQAAADDGRTALALGEQLRGDKPYSLWVGQAAVLLARALATQGQTEAAGKLYSLAVAQLTGTLGPDHTRTRAARLLAQAGAGGSATTIQAHSQNPSSKDDKS